MNKNFLALGLAAALLAPQVAGAEGFAINEWSAEGVAMGGARMFAEDDANTAPQLQTAAEFPDDLIQLRQIELRHDRRFDQPAASDHEPGETS